MPQNEQAFTAEELRLAELFDHADRLSEDASALDRFLDQLDPRDSAEVISALACANALRMAGSESPPPLTGTAWARILAALYPDLDPETEAWDFRSDSPEVIEKSRRDSQD